MTIALVLKVIHVIAAITAVGANLTYAFWLRRAGTDDRERLVFTIESIRRLDNMIATPAYVVVLLTGLGMVFSGVFSFGDLWLQVALVLYVLVVLIGIFLYSPTIKRQVAEAEKDPKSDAYRAVASRSNLLGLAVVAIVLVIVFLMVAKPF